MNTRVVITGLGIVSPIGIGIGQFWKAALEGHSGISAIRAFDDLPLEAYRCRVAGQVVDFNPAQYLDPVQAELIDGPAGSHRFPSSYLPWARNAMTARPLSTMPNAAIARNAFPRAGQSYPVRMSARAALAM